MRRLLALLALALLAGCGPRLAPRPPAILYPTAHEARVAIMALGLRVVPVTGTGSMAPWIPAHPGGKDVIVAFAGLDRTPYESLVRGDVVVYSLFGQSVIHRLGERDSRGFVAYGLANHDKDRRGGYLGFVTPDTFIGKVAQVHLYPLK